jgi:glycosyltransferase involved in cell wall biosynthesis
MRIAYVCADPGVPIFGRKGSSVHVQEVVRALMAQGATVEIFAARVDGEPPHDLSEVTVHQLPELPKSTQAEREHAALVANGALYAMLEEFAPFDMVYERYSLWSFSGMQYAHDKEIPGLLEVNAPLVEEQATHRGLVDRDLAQWVAGKVFGAATALLAVSREVARYVEGFPGAAGRVHVVPNGVNPGRFMRSAARHNGNHSDTFTVGFVGTLKPWHGLATLAHAFGLLHNQYPDTKLLVVGDGPERSKLEKELEAGGALAATHFMGSVDPSEVPGILALMDVAVAPYEESEHFYFSPLKVYEYMAAALPVVASKVGQLDGLIEHEVNGLLCPPGDAVALAASLGRLRRDPALRAYLGRCARESVLKDHTWDAVATRILDLAEQHKHQHHYLTVDASAVGRA